VAIASCLCAAGALAQQEPSSTAAGDIGSGQQLFQTNCAACHGADAKGTPHAPDLLQRVKGMSEDRFTEAVLRRYSWSVPSTESGQETAPREAMARGLLQRRITGGGMPAWEGHPEVQAGVRQLFRYLDMQARQAAR
jgi:mono/diheme cytochrome c family protein